MPKLHSKINPNIIPYGAEVLNIKANSEIYGGKGAGLIDMTNLNLPVPFFGIIPAQYCILEKTEEEEAEIISKVLGNLKTSNTIPHLVSVRSGARVSMPGMMDTILNVGMRLDDLPYWCSKLGIEAAYDSFCRLLCMMGETCYGVEKSLLSAKYHAVKKVAKTKDAKTLYAQLYADLINTLLGEGVEPFWEDSDIQMKAAVRSVWASWDSDRAKEYRKIHGYSDNWGTAVIIQQMVFGNLDDKSCSGVLFTRNPDTGDNTVFGEFLINAQGEDVVSGVATPLPLNDMASWNAALLEDLIYTVTNLEKTKRDMLDIEFTVESGNLYFLQVRTGKRSSKAAFKIAYDLYNDGLITLPEAIARCTYKDYQAVSKPGIDYSKAPKEIYVGIPASSGVAVGKLTTDPQIAINNPGQYILFRPETTPDDLKAMIASAGIVTILGGATSHAAVVARGLGIPCIVGCTEISIINNFIKYKGEEDQEYLATAQSPVTIDGSTGYIWVHHNVPTTEGASKYAESLLQEHLGAQNTWFYDYARKDQKPTHNVIHVGSDMDLLEQTLNNIGVEKKTTIILGNAVTSEIETEISVLMGHEATNLYKFEKVLAKYQQTFKDQITVIALEDFYRKILAEYKIQTTPLCTTIPDILNATTEALLDIKDLDADSMTALAVLAKKAGIKVHSKTSLLSYGTLVKSSFTA